MELLHLKLHSQNNNGNYEPSLDTNRVEEQPYRTVPVQRLVNLGPFYTDLPKIGISRPIFLKDANAGCRSRQNQKKIFIETMKIKQYSEAQHGDCNILSFQVLGSLNSMPTFIEREEHSMATPEVEVTTLVQYIIFRSLLPIDRFLGAPVNSY